MLVHDISWVYYFVITQRSNFACKKVFSFRNIISNSNILNSASKYFCKPQFFAVSNFHVQNYHNKHNFLRDKLVTFQQKLSLDTYVLTSDNTAFCKRSCNLQKK